MKPTESSSENWTADPEFLQLFGNIYDYVKELQLKPVHDLPETFSEVLQNFKIRESRLQDANDNNRRDKREIRAHGFATTKLEIQTSHAETVYTSVILNNKGDKKGIGLRTIIIRQKL